MRSLIIISGLMLSLIIIAFGASRHFHMSQISNSASGSSDTNNLNQIHPNVIETQQSNYREASGNQSLREYVTGYKLGECLITDGCQVFTGMIQSVGESKMETSSNPNYAVIYREISMTVDEQIWGNIASPYIQLMSAMSPKFTKTAAGPWIAWETANLKVGERLLVVLWSEKSQRPQWEGQPEKVALATSDASSLTALREIVQRHRQYNRSPEVFVNITQQPDIISNSFFLGYTMAYLKRKEEIRNIDNAALIFSSLLKNKQVPDYIRSDISFQLLGNFYRLSDNTRRVATEALVDAGASDYSRSSESAISVLVRLGDDKLLDMSAFLTPSRQRKLVENYQLIMSREGHNRKDHPEFESQLGIEKP